MKLKTLLIVVGALVGVLLLSNSVYVVKEIERAVKLRFGEFANADIAPGIHFKIPFAEQVRKFDARVLTVEAPARRYLTIEQKPLEVDSFAKWRIGDVASFYRSTSGDEAIGSNRLLERVNEGLRNEISRRPQYDVVSGERDEFMDDLRALLNEEMMDEMGIEVIDVRVKQIDLPTEVEDAVHQRMNSAREIEANQYRADGEELAIARKADADKQVTVLTAEAYRDAEEIRGDGDAQATKIYADAFDQDREFYAFTRRMTAFAASFSDKGDTLILDPESDFFRYLQSGELP
ncbi:MAG: protease modulator HflC [Gammaproteobacteria bacterium]|nr:protease modulator HflC [Gammaproteobacteria bacterium]MDE0444805.1 protease modulator HflC [Gammaproteobacteria bacterium]